MGNEYIQTLMTIFILPGINSKFSVTDCTVFLQNKFHSEHEMCNTGVGRRLPSDMLTHLGRGNTIVTLQSDGYHYFENNTWSTEILLHDYSYYTYSKCIPTGMVFCPLWTDISFVNCTRCSGKNSFVS